MTTLADLVQEGEIVRIEVALAKSDLPQRLIYGARGFITWLQERIKAAEVSPLGADQTPAEQLDWLFYRFITGLPLQPVRDYRVLRHEMHPIWELKTVDLRVFGWFAQKDCFVAVFGDWADKVKDHDLYRGYRVEIRRLRRNWRAVPDLSIEGETPGDVLSI